MPRSATLLKLTDQTISEPGSSAEFDLSAIDTVWVAVLAGAEDGTDPVLQVVLEQKDASGNWIVVAPAPAAINSVPSYVSAIIGRNAGGYLANVGRLSWTVAGTDPEFSGVDLSVMGA